VDKREAERSSMTNDHPYRSYLISSPAVFIVTCGAGASQGFKDWAKVLAEGAADAFGSPEAFAEIRAQERVLWFEVEWNPAVDAMRSCGYLDVTGQGHGRAVGPGRNGSWSYQRRNPNDIATWQWFGYYQTGSFLYIQRLETAPSDGGW
jgi:hypothetical protein